MFVLKIRRLLFILPCAIVVLCLLNFIMQPFLVTKIYYFFKPEKSLYCYNDNKESLRDIMTVNPPRGRSIFFHETSCNSHNSGKIVIGSRQACAVESAARMNPNYSVYLLFTSPGVIRYEATESDRFLQALAAYSNINILRVNYENYTKDTPVEALYRDGKIAYSSYAQSHASDLLRYVTLWKYGGVYLDLDVVVIKSLDSLMPNYAGAESDANVAAGVLRFEPDGRGHEYARSCLEDLEHNYRANEWGYNGPGVITRLLRKLCNAEEAKDMLNKDCAGFSVYEKKYFYPIPWPKWFYYFEAEHNDEVDELSADSYVVHVWNKHSNNQNIPLQSDVPYVRFAKQYCPKVFFECDTHF